MSDYGLRAEARGVEEGHQARRAGKNRWLVKSESNPDLTYNVVAVVPVQPGAPVRTRCSCPSGNIRGKTHTVACKHVTRVARQLEREGAVEWRDGAWYTPFTKVPDHHGDDDPFDNPWKG